LPSGLNNPLFLSARRLDTNTRDASPLPAALSNSLAVAAMAHLAMPKAQTA
jgi:hypothetical protein